MDTTHSHRPPEEDRPFEEGHPSRTTDSRLFAWLHSTGWTRSDDGWAGGVFGLLARRLGWDVNLVRGLGVLVLIVLFSPAALLYGVAWMLVPDRSGRILAQRASAGEFSVGFYGAAAVMIVGAFNLFVPAPIVGPLAIVATVLVLAGLAWLLARILRGDQAADTASTASVPSADRHSGRTAAPHESSATPAAGTERRRDGRPPWYPRDTGTVPPPSDIPPERAPGSAGAGRDGSRPRRTVAVVPPRARRRRRLLIWGTVLLMIPLTAALTVLAGTFGVPVAAVLAAGAAVLVGLLALLHMRAALRGRRGHGVLLSGLTAVMLVLLAVHQSGLGASFSADGSSVHAFANYTSSSEATHAAFSRGTVDLRSLGESAAATDSPAGRDAADPITRSIDVNSAFARTTVVVPDDAAVTVENAQALSNLTVHTGDSEDGVQGIGVEELVLGSDDAALQLTLNLNSAFSSVAIYDETAYGRR